MNSLRQLILFTTCLILLSTSIGWAQPFVERNVLLNNARGVREVEAVDMDMDGDLDVLAYGRIAPFISWFENKGNDFFQQHIKTVAHPRTKR